MCACGLGSVSCKRKQKLANIAKLNVNSEHLNTDRLRLGQQENV